MEPTSVSARRRLSRPQSVLLLCLRCARRGVCAREAKGGMPQPRRKGEGGETAEILHRSGKKPPLGGPDVDRKEWQVPAYARRGTAPVPSPEPGRPQRCPTWGSCPCVPHTHLKRKKLGRGRESQEWAQLGVCQPQARFHRHHLHLINLHQLHRTNSG